MEQNMISLFEVKELMKEVRKKTDDFLNDLKLSIFLEKNGNIVNPNCVQIRYFNDSYYTLRIDDFSFRLNENGGILLPSDLTEEEQVEYQKVLNTNSHVITDALTHLQENPPTYYVAFTNTAGYGGFNCKIGEDSIAIGPNVNELSFRAKQLSEYKIIYKIDIINSDRIMVDYNQRMVLIDEIDYTLRNKVGLLIFKKLLKKYLSTTQVNIEDLPMVLKNQIKSKQRIKKNV